MKRFWWCMSALCLLNFTCAFILAMYYGWTKDYPHACYDFLVAGFALYWSDYFMEKC